MLQTIKNQDVLANKRKEESKKRTDNMDNRQMVMAYKKQFAAALPSQIGADRFSRICLSIFNNNGDLMKCTQKSLIGALLNCAQLGLEPNTPLGHAYLIPYNNKQPDGTWAKEVQLQIGYQGMLELARRAGVAVVSHVVYENDDFYMDYMNPDNDRHAINPKGTRGVKIGYYAKYKTKEGFTGSYYMSVADAEEYRDHFTKDKYHKGPWYKDDTFDAMACKTCIKQALKYAPKAVELSAAIAQDDTVKNADLDDLVKAQDMTLVNNTADYEDAEYTEQEETPAIDHQSTQIPEDWADMYVEDPLTGELIPKDESKEKVKA